MTQFNTMQEIKRGFFAMRNGIVAETIRRGGLNYKMVFGLNLPQIAEIAGRFSPSADLAEELWADRRTRESMLLAPMLYPLESLSAARAVEMLVEAPTTEVADILCHKLLRRHQAALSIAAEAVASSEALTRYGGFRLMFNLVYTHPAEVRPFAEAGAASESGATAKMCADMLAEIRFMAGEE